jgi:hypothetical protein
LLRSTSNRAQAGHHRRPKLHQQVSVFQFHQSFIQL